MKIKHSSNENSGKNNLILWFIEVFLRVKNALGKTGEV